MKSKKLLALLLALVMSLGCLCVSALAADGDHHLKAIFDPQTGAVKVTADGLTSKRDYLISVLDQGRNLAAMIGAEPKNGAIETEIAANQGAIKQAGVENGEYLVNLISPAGSALDHCTITMKDESGDDTDPTIGGTDVPTDPTPSDPTPTDPTPTDPTPTDPTPVDSAPADSTPAPAAAPVFVDIDTGAYYADAVKWAVEKGVTNGTGANTFSPNASCTRGQVVTFLWRAAGSPEPKATATAFTDLGGSSEYYYKAVLWAVENNITNGTDATRFSPDATVTRGQVVTFLYRFEKAVAAAGNRFADVDADAFYAPSVSWAYENGITNGTSDTTFSPNADCTRAQIVTFLYRDIVK